MAETTAFTKFRDEINDRLDFEELYSKYGVETVGTPNGSGWVSAYSHPVFGGRDNNPSASINLRTGYYHDFRSALKAMHLFDFLEIIGEFTTREEAEFEILKQYGIRQPKLSKNHPLSGVKFQPWHSIQCKGYLKAKPGITEEGLKKSGAMFCTRYDTACFAWPMYDQNLVVVGWHFIQRNGQPFKNKAKAITKMFAGAEQGFIGTPAIEWLGNQFGEIPSEADEGKDRNCYLFEGAPDMLAAYSNFIDGIFIANCSGAGQVVTDTQAHLLSGGNVRSVTIVADADEPGILGAFKKAENLKKMGVHKVFVRSPKGFQIQKDHGPDFRDYVVKHISPRAKEGEKFYGEDLNNFLANQVSPEKAKEIDRKKDEQDNQFYDLSIQKAINFLERCNLQIVFRQPPDGITFYNIKTHYLREVKKLDSLKYEQMILFAGPVFVKHVARFNKEKDESQISFVKFLEFCGMAATRAPAETSDKIGAGIWALTDEDTELTGELVLVQNNECYTLNGSKLTRSPKPVFQNVMADLQCKEKWIEPEILSDLLPRSMEPDFRRETYSELFRYISSWRWAHKDMDMVACGAFLATWIQTIWKWRPIIALTGESSSGKTMLLEFMDKMCLGLSNLSGNSTAAGVKQAIGYSASQFFLDEFDSGTEQEKLLRAFRVSSRGQDTLQGTADQTGVRYKIRHMPWLSGIFASSERQADLNRMIQLSILNAKGTKILTPNSPGATRDLGRRILAGVLVTANRAHELSLRLSSTEASKVPIRYRESYSVPFAALAAFIDMPFESMEGIMCEYLDSVVFSELETQDTETDQEDALAKILSSTVQVGMDAPRNRATVAEILFMEEFELHQDLLGTIGIAIVNPRKAPGRRVAFCASQLAKSMTGILPEWGAGLGQIISRLGPDLGTRGEKQRVGGVLRHCTTVDYDKLKNWAFGRREELFK